MQEKVSRSTRTETSNSTQAAAHKDVKSSIRTGNAKNTVQLGCLMSRPKADSADADAKKSQELQRLLHSRDFAEEERQKADDQLTKAKTKLPPGSTPKFTEIRMTTPQQWSDTEQADVVSHATAVLKAEKYYPRPYDGSEDVFEECRNYLGYFILYTVDRIKYTSRINQLRSEGIKTAWERRTDDLVAAAALHVGAEQSAIANFSETAGAVTRAKPQLKKKE